MASACTSCKKSPPEVHLKRCAKCSTTRYCSRDCQKADWKAHKKICGRQADATTSFSDGPATANLSPPKGLEQGVACPFTRLDNGTWLHDRSEKDVYGLLIDAYRLRVEDMYNMEGEADTDSIYGGAADGLRGFQHFLERVVACPGLLPPWWDAKKKRDCELLGMTPSQWYDLRSAVHKSDIIENYGDSQFPMQFACLPRQCTVKLRGDKWDGNEADDGRNGAGQSRRHALAHDGYVTSYVWSTLRKRATRDFWDVPFLSYRRDLSKNASPTGSFAAHGPEARELCFGSSGRWRLQGWGKGKETASKRNH